MVQAEIVFLGEIHDNPAHHLTQARFVKAVAPKAVVFEMLTAEVAQSLSDASLVSVEVLERATSWSETGWPALEMYFPIFEAARGASIYGAALPRSAARAAMKQGIADSFGVNAREYGLTSALPEDQQSQREALQMAAHCDALPEHLLPTMVDLQRLRDAMLARAALRALAETGGPVFVITGNGHARRDWGAPSFVAKIRPDVTMFALSQTEDHVTPDPAFDLVMSAPAIDSPDPCAAFR
jgi:uncharacterized iron-regulated protein